MREMVARVTPNPVPGKNKFGGANLIKPMLVQILHHPKNYLMLKLLPQNWRRWQFIFAALFFQVLTTGALRAFPKEMAESHLAFTVSGTVTDQETGEPLPGVNIVVKGTETGTVTDMDGLYSIEVEQESDVLVFSFIGYTSQEITINGRSTIDVQLASDLQAMQEVVVIGYGTREKSQVTGAISSVSSADIASVPVISPDQALQGRAAGVDVIASGHAPGAGATVRIRGINSINANNNPLFVLDGIPISGGLNDINPNIIASIEVLKDASATAIYGARGSNGVVLITTKRGSEGRTRVNYDSYIGFTEILNKVDVLDAEGWVRYKEASRKTDDLTVLLDPVELTNYNAGREVDWQDLILQKGLQQSHSIGVSGGNDKTQFSVSANYLEQRGIVVNSDFKRGSFQINLDHQINDRMKIGTSTLFSTSKTNVVNGYRLIGQAMQISPLGSVFNEDGSLRLFPTSEALLGSPVIDGANEVNQQFRTRVFSSIYGEYELIKGLKYRLNFGPDFSFGNNGHFLGSNTTTLQGGTNRASNSRFDNKSYTLENLLIYTRTLKDQHNLEVTLLQSIQEQFDENNFIESMGIPSEKMLWHDLSSGQIRSFDTGQETWSILSFMARVNYTLQDKYLLTLTARRDGSSRFGEDRKYGYFPSIALGWRIIEEGFMKDFSMVTDLKLRASYGSIGNTAINPYQSQGSLSRHSYLFGSEPALGFEPNTLANPDLRWETSTTANVGVDFGLFNNRLTGTLEYYQINTTDLLLNRRLPTFTGYSNILTNIGATRNTGFEVTLSAVNVDIPGGLKWTTDFNAAINRNEIVELYGEGDDVGNSWFIGEPINVYYDLVFDGIWQEHEADVAASFERQPGQVKIRDVNADNQITAEDREILGSSIPKWSGGITNKFSYKGIDLSVFINTRQDFMINSELHAIDNLAGRYNIPTFVNYYTPENPSNDYPQPVNQGENNINMNVLRYRDGSFVRVRNINLGYNLPNNLVSGAGIQSVRVYVNAQNPFTFTKYEGWDPESGGALSSYPSTKMFLVGVNASF
jgi:TonB-linked SusC/RagA family outer membrane protein